MKKIIKLILGENLYRKIAAIKYEADLEAELKNTIRAIQRNQHRKSIFLFLTPIHANIGDLAIAEAEMRFLKKHFSAYNIIEISHPLAYRFVEKAKDKIRRTDLMMLHGGGNLGNHYIHEEHARRMILKEFPNNPIVSFPQTVYYTEDGAGPRELKISQDIISNHANLTLVARERTSYGLMQEYFSETKVLLMPDIVLSMDETLPSHNRDGIMIVLREDGEKSLRAEDHREIDQLARRYFDKVTYSDMIYHKEVDKKDRYNEVLANKFNEFKSHQLVITDRLHGMVFAAITGTPCIALANYNHKVSGTYEWIKDLEYIKYVESPKDLEPSIQALTQLKEFKLHNKFRFADYYRLITDEIKVALS